MRKGLVVFMAVVASLLVCYSGAYADNVKVGDELEFYNYQSTGGGLIDAYNVSQLNYHFATFCIHYNNISAGAKNKVIGISSQSLVDGIPLDYRTAWLYSEFRAGTLLGYNGTTARAAKIQWVLQWAIRSFQQQTGWTSQTNSGSGFAGSDADWDLANSTAKVGNLNGVQVLNMADYYGQGDKEDMPVLVPEPASLLLLGVGLLGLGALRRRKA